MTNILFIIGVLGLAILVCGFRGRKKDRQIQEIYRKEQAERPPLSALEFCSRANIPNNNADYVSRFRNTFAEIGAFDPLRMYPEDDFTNYGISYDDEMAMFLAEKGLLLDHPEFRYSFPLEETKDFGELIKVTQKINKKISGEKS